VPAEGLEPPNSEEGGFTVPSNCRYAIQAFNVILQGFEPRTTEPKSVVLPLHHRIVFRFVKLIPNGVKKLHLISFLRSQDRIRTCTPHYRERDTATNVAVAPNCHLTILFQ
jgi:hypothetical protein